MFDHWIAQGVTIFRVDNPHTKPFPFWEWCIAEVKREHPEVLFLAEAFTRPKVMQRLAKLGFTQSYTYFTWRNTKEELTEYFTELSQGPACDYFRPNVWPNTPDILHEQLQNGEAPVFTARLILAATLAASYGIYGPAYELLEHTPRDPGSEEYLDSEKYQLRPGDDTPPAWRPSSRASTASAATTRRCRATRRCASCAVDNDHLLAYLKGSDDGSNVVVTVVNLDLHNAQSGRGRPHARIDRRARRPVPPGARPAERPALHRGRAVKLREAGPAEHAVPMCVAGAPTHPRRERLRVLP